MTDIQPIKLWLTPPGPNPYKVLVILEELSLPYEIISFKFDDVKKPPFVTLNPNGRVPAIEDPNTGLTLWESGAIILYLVEQYDTQGRLTHGDKVVERNLERQWLMFQMSGQGPYFGQAAWFNILHPERIPSAMARYSAEVRRILSILDGHLATSPYLVGDKLTYADFSFIPWNSMVDILPGESKEEVFKGYKNVVRWQDSIMARDSWKKCVDTRAIL
ncbi:glutathione S-transferase domain-containing protein [Trematosphaeria pertusa]|uniref:glutathione transferase n=1 Tax=Trematosphaeria pertusa TaxID=390896 RepID=A0A6A6I228_9PLEO|nr:glutathione S-transferase domain-containing protein [Trematosphaeria pertusa]KAF2244525.1 glutathione S-transferase domain-containing protein [Trematosphaeria pertusa]